MRVGRKDRLGFSRGRDDTARRSARRFRLSRKDKTAAGESHTSFALGEGETLYLIAPGGTIADRAACDPELPADHVLRRENGGELTESVWATPGYPNTAAGYAAFCESRKTESPLVIYEAAVYNDTFALKGEYYDWVEIKNVSKESVKLSDYCLSDDRRELEKWSLPKRTLAKGQSILYLLHRRGEPDDRQRPAGEFRAQRFE